MLVRLVSPAQRLGWELVQGAEWLDGALAVFPERLEQADLVIITRDFPTWIDEYRQVIAAARRYGKPVVYETDDLLLELPEGHPDYERYLAARAAMLQAVVEADAVVGSTPELCDYLRSFNSNTRLWENYLDDRLWQVAGLPSNAARPGDQAGDRLVSIGYMGGHSHVIDLEPVVPALIRILEKYPSKVQLKFWGLEPPASLRDHPAVEHLPVGLVDYASFAAYFSTQTCDLFIAPLQDNLFNRCKSPLKFLEYSALGVPGVYSRAPAYQRLVRHGENGFLAGELDEWVGCLSRLIEDAALRLRLGAEARATLCSHWLLSDHAPEFDRLYRGLAANASALPGRSSAAALRQEGLSQGLQVAQKMAAFYQELLRVRQADNRSSLQLDALKAELQEQRGINLNLNRIAQEYYALYLEIMHSRSWLLLQRLIDWRLRLAPLGSRRDQLVKAAYQSASALKNQGLRAFLRTGLHGLQAVIQPPAPAQPVEATSPGLRSLLFDGRLPAGSACTLPAITIIEFKNNPGASAIETPALLGWLNGQTLPQAAQVVTWDQAAGAARLLDHQDLSWEAGDLQALLQGIATPYICFASPDLLEQDPAFLEFNLCALQAGSLAFTVNLRGPSAWSMRCLEEGRLPGDLARPLLRQVVRKDCLSQDPSTGQVSLDLRLWLEDRHKSLQGNPALAGQGVVVGRIVSSMTTRVDLEGELPFEQPGSFAVLGRHLILPGSTTGLEHASLAHLSFPLDQVLPILPEPSNLPTVILVQPFLAVGGAEKIALKIIQQLAGRMRFVVLTFDEMDPQLGTMADEFRQATPYVYTLPDFADGCLNASALDYLVARFDPRSIYIHNGTPWIYDALGEIKRRHPDVRLVDQVYDYQVGWINRYDPSVVLYLDGHIGSNPKICQAYRDKGARPEQVYFIENGSNSQELDPGRYDAGTISNLKIKLGLPPQARVVAFASRLHSQKRPMDFVELARRFSNDPQVTFLMAGDGPLAAQVDEQIRKIGLRNLVRCPFYRPISDLLALTDVLVLPSEFEGMPMIVLEAQTMGVPVVVTDVGNNREVLERTQGGLVLPQIGDVSALMQAVEQMLDHPPDPVAVRQNTVAIFDWKVLAQKYYAALIGDLDG